MTSSLVISIDVGGLFFFFKQKTAYELRISDWSSDVCFFRSGQLTGLQEALSQVAQVAKGIDAIAKQTNLLALNARSEERRVGKECVSTCSSRWSPSH